MDRPIVVLHGQARVNLPYPNRRTQYRPAGEALVAGKTRVLAWICQGDSGSHKQPVGDSLTPLFVVQDALCQRVAHKLRPCAETQLFHPPRTIRFDGFHAEGQLIRDFTVGMSQRDQSQDI